MGGRRGYGLTHSQNIEKHFLFLPNIRMIALNSYINPINIYKSLINNDYMPTIVIEDKIGYTKKLCEIEIRGYKVMRSSEDFLPCSSSLLGYSQSDYLMLWWHVG
jgi:2-oxoisovalerate dehydrogenase E1 component